MAEYFLLLYLHQLKLVQHNIIAILGVDCGVNETSPVIIKLLFVSKAYRFRSNYSFWIRKFGELGPQDSLFGESTGPNR